MNSSSNFHGRNDEKTWIVLHKKWKFQADHPFSASLKYLLSHSVCKEG